MHNKKIWYLLFGLLTIACIYTAIKLANYNEKAEEVHFAEDVKTENLTLLERMYDDADLDGKDESIELYTSAQRGKDGFMEWDDGQRWLLLVSDEGNKFPLFSDYLQLGQLEFWVGIFNKSGITSSNVELERHIYVMRTGNGIQLSDYYWDKQKQGFKKEVVFAPPAQWAVKASNKYSCFDPTLIEPRDVRE